MTSRFLFHYNFDSGVFVFMTEAEECVDVNIETKTMFFLSLPAEAKNICRSFISVEHIRLQSPC